LPPRAASGDDAPGKSNSNSNSSGNSPDGGGNSNRPSSRPRSNKSKHFSGSQRRRGRPAWMRSPTDSPLRDGNRDRLVGLLTER